MFVSNSDNLDATLDLKILAHFAKTDVSFMMECCECTENNKKGGHLAIRKSDNHLILRKSVMCADKDEASFQDVTRHSSSTQKTSGSAPTSCRRSSTSLKGSSRSP